MVVTSLKFLNEQKLVIPYNALLCSDYYLIIT